VAGSRQAGQSSAYSEQKNTKCDKLLGEITFWLQKFQFQVPFNNNNNNNRYNSIKIFEELLVFLPFFRYLCNCVDFFFAFIFVYCAFCIIGCVFLSLRVNKQEFI
jgi:hypothetical protein